MQLRLYRNTRLAEKHERNSTQYISHIAAIKDSAHSLRNIYERRQYIDGLTRRFILDRIYYLPPLPPDKLLTNEAVNKAVNERRISRCV